MSSSANQSQASTKQGTEGEEVANLGVCGTDQTWQGLQEQSPPKSPNKEDKWSG